MKCYASLANKLTFLKYVDNFSFSPTKLAVTEQQTFVSCRIRECVWTITQSLLSFSSSFMVGNVTHSQADTFTHPFGLCTLKTAFKTILVVSKTCSMFLSLASKVNECTSRTDQGLYNTRQSYRFYQQVTRITRKLIDWIPCTLFY